MAELKVSSAQVCCFAFGLKWGDEGLATDISIASLVTAMLSLSLAICY